MKKVITCSTCDTRSATEESLSAFEKIIINTSDLLVSPESKIINLSVQEVSKGNK